MGEVAAAENGDRGAGRILTEVEDGALVGVEGGEVEDAVLGDLDGAGLVVAEIEGAVGLVAAGIEGLGGEWGKEGRGRWLRGGGSAWKRSAWGLRLFRGCTAARWHEAIRNQ